MGEVRYSRTLSCSSESDDLLTLTSTISYTLPLQNETLQVAYTKLEIEAGRLLSRRGELEADVHKYHQHLQQFEKVH